MTSRDFCYWLQGYFEIHGKNEVLTIEQCSLISRHLAMVFKHEIDPGMGDTLHQKELNEIHCPGPKDANQSYNPNTLFRC